MPFEPWECSDPRCACHRGPRCDECGAVHPVAAAIFDEWLTTWHTGFCAGFMGRPGATFRWPQPQEQAAAYADGYRAGRTHKGGK